MIRTRISVPSTAARGDVVQIRTIASHPMETGFRRDIRGDVIPQDILIRFVCRYNGTEVFRTDFFPGTAANPYLTFFLTASESGPIVFEWTDQHGTVTTEERTIEVS